MPHGHRLVRLVVALSIALASSQGLDARAQAQSDLRATYDAALKCFIANGHARGLRLRAGDAAKASYYEGKGKQAYEAAEVVAYALHRSRDQFGADVQAMQDRELPRMVHDDDYFRAAVADCKAMGLM